MFIKYKYDPKNKSRIINNLKMKFRKKPKPIFPLKPSTPKNNVKGYKLQPVDDEVEKKMIGKPVLKDNYNVDDIYDDLMKE